MYDIILAFITAFSLTFLAIPSIISIAKKKNLMDEPGDRRSHTVRTPSLGGIAIFAGTLFSIILWTPFEHFGDLQYILCSFIIIFLIGAKDDIDPISPRTKLLGELFAAAILVFRANVRITSLYGIFGVQDISYIPSVFLSIFTIIVIINAFNLIDGINGLSGGIGTLITVLMGLWFLKIDRIELAMISFALAGSLVAFLYYNVTPAKIFMGDTGALLLGLVASILAIQFIEIHRDLGNSEYAFKSAPTIAVSILILPLFDTLRVFVGRVSKGKSPLSPDRTHIHHMLIDTGLTHMKAAFILISINMSFILFAVCFQDLGDMILMPLLLILALIMSESLAFFVRKKKLNT